MQSEPVLSLIVAYAAGGIIGRNNSLPWRIPSDIKRFKKLTTGHPVIMGRKNWESIPEKFRPLSGRTNIIVTRQIGYAAENAVVTNSFGDAYSKATNAPGADEIFIIGGEEIYRLFLPFVEKAYVTYVDTVLDGDARFPEMSASDWLCVDASPTCRWNPYDCHETSFRIYKRKKKQKMSN